MQNASLISTCSFGSQWPWPSVAGVQPSFGSPQGGKSSTLRATGVLKEAMVISGVERMKVLSASIALSWPLMVCYTNLLFPTPPQPQLTIFSLEPPLFLAHTLTITTTITCFKHLSYLLDCELLNFRAQVFPYVFRAYKISNMYQELHKCLANVLMHVYTCEGITSHAE